MSSWDPKTLNEKYATQVWHISQRPELWHVPQVRGGLRKMPGLRCEVKHVHWNNMLPNYPLVNVYITMERSTHFIAGKIHYKGPFSIAMLVITRG